MRISPDKLLYIRKSCYSRIYLIKNNPLYLLKEHFFSERIINEYNTLKLLEKNGFFNIPEFKLLEINKRKFLALKILPGNPLSYSKITDKQMLMVVKTLDRLHSIKNNLRVEDFIQSRISGLNSLFEEYKLVAAYRKDNFLLTTREYLSEPIMFLNRISDKISQPTEKCSMLHGELSFEHIFLNKNKIKLIDWENSVFGDPDYDLAALSSDNQSLQKNFIARYSGLTKRNFSAKRINFYLLLSRIDHALRLMISSIISVNDFENGRVNNIEKFIYKKTTLDQLEKVRELRNAL